MNGKYRNFLAGLAAGAMLWSGGTALAAGLTVIRCLRPGSGWKWTASTPMRQGAVTIPQLEGQLVLKEGDKVLCDDGSLYEITDMSRFDNNVFSAGPLPSLPSPHRGLERIPHIGSPQRGGPALRTEPVHPKPV